MENVTINIVVKGKIIEKWWHKTIGAKMNMIHYASQLLIECMWKHMLHTYNVKKGISIKIAFFFLNEEGIYF